MFTMEILLVPGQASFEKTACPEGEIDDSDNSDSYFRTPAI